MHTVFLPRAPRCSHPATPAAIAPTRLRIEPADQWPTWANAVAKFRRKTDTGLGDTLQALIGDARSAKFKAWFTRKFGVSCGCSERRNWLNRKFPY